MEAKHKRESIGLDRMAPQFPLLPLTDEQELMLTQELQLRQQVSGEHSACLLLAGLACAGSRSRAGRALLLGGL